MIRMGLVAVLGLAMAGCATFHSSYDGIKLGMTKAQVAKAMHGCPGLEESNGSYSAMTYYSEMPDFFQLSAHDYGFIFKDDQLVDFGIGRAGKDKRPDGELIMFIQRPPPGNAIPTPAPTPTPQVLPAARGCSIG